MFSMLPPASTQKPRRVLALVLSGLVCELLRRTEQARPSARDFSPLGVVLFDSVDEREQSLPRLDPRSRLDAVDARAQRAGIAVGQRIRDAQMLDCRLRVRAYPRRICQEMLAHLAESLLDCTSVVAIEPPDTIWLEIGTVSHLWGGERELAQELLVRMQERGHQVQLAVASGPRAAQLLARTRAQHHPQGLFVTPEQVPRLLAELPIAALPFDAEGIGWLGRLGVLTLGDLSRLPEGELVERVGRQAKGWLALAQGQDHEPLIALCPQRTPKESQYWDHPLEGLEPLRFVLRRLLSSLEARLNARGEAALSLRVTIQHDPSTARHLQVPDTTLVELELSTPLRESEALERIVVCRLERLNLPAPSVGLTIELLKLNRITAQQLLLPFSGTIPRRSRAVEVELQQLLTELGQEVGNDRLGFLSPIPDHRPEQQSRLLPYGCPIPNGPSAPGSPGPWRLPTRLLHPPLRLELSLCRGATLFVGHDPYVVQSLCFDSRLDGIDWWRTSPTSRDYFRVWLKGASDSVEALVYIDRNTRAHFLQGIVD